MIKQTIWNNQTTYYLSNDDISIWLNPSDGMNLYEILYQGKPLIKFYEDRLIEDKTCSVMTLFPTPNRIRDGVLSLMVRNIMEKITESLSMQPFKLTIY